MVWLIGNNGMLGHDVESALKKNGLEYQATDLDTDITDLQALKQYIKDKRIDFIINCAAYTNVDGAEEEQERAEAVNAGAVRNISLVAKESNAVLIHISTDYVFNGSKKDPYTEKDSTDPLGFYGKSKLKGEEAVQELLQKYFIIRTAWLYGPNGKNFVHTMLRLFNEHKEIKVVNDQYGSPSYTVDLADIIIKVIKENKTAYGIYHFSNEGKTTWHEFALEIYKQALENGLLKKERNIKIIPVNTEDYPTVARRPQNSLLSKEKLKKTLGIEVRDWSDALKEFIVSIKKREEI